MAVPDFATASPGRRLICRWCKKKDIELTQNMDSILEKMFARSTKEAGDIGEQDFRHPIQFNIGGHTGGYQPDGSIFFWVSAPASSEFIIAPVPMVSAFAATELDAAHCQGRSSGDDPRPGRAHGGRCQSLRPRPRHLPPDLQQRRGRHRRSQLCRHQCGPDGERELRRPPDRHLRKVPGHRRQPERIDTRLSSPTSSRTQLAPATP